MIIFVSFINHYNINIRKKSDKYNFYFKNLSLYIVFWIRVSISSIIFWTTVVKVSVDCNLFDNWTSVIINSSFFKKLEGGIDIDWTKVEDVNDLDLKSMLYDAGYTAATETAASVFVRQNQAKVLAVLQEIQDLKDRQQGYKDEEKQNKDYSSKQLLREPIYTDKEVKLVSF